MIPFASSAARYSDWLRVLLMKDAETSYISAKDVALSFPSVRGKEQARTMIDGGIMLSVPVVGGGARLKRECGRDIMISDHGRWQDVHLGAIKAVYGKTPYFAHLFPVIKGIYRDHGIGSLEDFNLALHHLALHWLGLDEEGLLEEIRGMSPDKKELLGVLAQEMRKDIDMNHSIFGLLFRLGRESLFAIL
ncbi:MAG: WbqC family protein [Muribaculaceae bacterium]|nr:WbqC family protein [Muribaculaceae bacterium]